MKTVYVLNLTSKRIAVLTGMMLIFMGTSFFFGGYFDADKKSLQFLSFLKNKSYERPIEEIETFTIEETETKELNASENEFYMRPAEIEPKGTLITKESSDNEILKPYSAPTKEDTTISKTENSSLAQVSFISQAPNKKTDLREHFSLQLGAFSKESEAVVFQKELKQKGVATRIDKGSKYYFIRTGKTASKNELNYLYNKIKNELKINVMFIKRKVSK
ncbi:MAG: SPOR domain-containing protein [Spirochaetia bacterium]|nr:SPOR domain-containing protein [Spirochaetia bacterium]